MCKFKYVIDKPYKTIRSYLEGFKLSKSKIYKLFLDKNVLVNDKVVNEHFSLKTNDVLTLYFSMKLDTKKVNKKLDIVYEDENVLLINKPVGILVHSDGNDGVTLDNYVASYLPNIDPMHVHRLDYETSGIIMYAKDPLSLSYYQDALSRHEISREYLALCSGLFNETGGTINKPIGTHRHINGKMVIYKNGKEAITHYTVLKQYKKYALVALKLETGRTHQIRVHMASIGHPLINDTLYQGMNFGGRIALHSHQISYYNPISKKSEHFTCNLNKDLLEYCL